MENVWHTYIFGVPGATFFTHTRPSIFSYYMYWCYVYSFENKHTNLQTGLMFNSTSRVKSGAWGTSPRIVTMYVLPIPVVCMVGFNGLFFFLVTRYAYFTKNRIEY
jgi:hypothetical protein